MQEFMDRFSSEESCRQYLADVRWAGTFKCPKCSHTESWKLARGIFKCKKCGRDISAMAGTIFHGSHIPLRLWFQALWCVVSQKNGVSALGLSRALGIRRQMTGVYLLREGRTAMVRMGRERPSGLVEVDEVFLGGVKPGKRGRGALGKVLVLVAVEDKGKKGIGRIRIEIISDANAVSLRAAIRKMVEPRGTVRTDEWKGYTPAALEEHKHVVVKSYFTAWFRAWFRSNRTKWCQAISPVREIGDPRVVRVRWCHHHQEIWIFNGLFLRLSPLSSSASVCLDPEDAHHALDGFLVHAQMHRPTTESVRWEFAQRLLDATLQFPITGDLLFLVVQRGAGAAEESRTGALRERRIVHHFFFWDSLSLSVISPTRRKSSSRSRFNFANSNTDGMPFAFDPSQPYMVASEMPCSLAADATETPSFLILLIICSRTSSAMRCFFISLHSNE